MELRSMLCLCCASHRLACVSCVQRVRAQPASSSNLYPTICPVDTLIPSDSAPEPFNDGL
ncbi:hypothetical protein BD311DRAFT_760766 [Dichomitus squalens]|uniref:Uncharacterized protein n=1 Tax=Dichomitus squalens TaxID=114155 RepID=A0A4Q9MMK5_9APHY|nr:hypothetical protein BD311DRAFT_760766 [Dichomitus squalens]